MLGSASAACGAQTRCKLPGGVRFFYGVRFNTALGRPTGYGIVLDMRGTVLSLPPNPGGLPGPAATAGVRVGQRIVKVDSTHVRGKEEVIRALSKGGPSVTFTLKGHGEEPQQQQPSPARSRASVWSAIAGDAPPAPPSSLPPPPPGGAPPPMPTFNAPMLAVRSAHPCLSAPRSPCACCAPRVRVSRFLIRTRALSSRAASSRPLVQRAAAVQARGPQARPPSPTQRACGLRARLCTHRGPCTP